MLKFEHNFPNPGFLSRIICTLSSLSYFGTKVLKSGLLEVSIHFTIIHSSLLRYRHSGEMVYYSPPLGAPGLPGPPIAISAIAFETNRISDEPTIRKNFPESWIFEDLKEYVKDEFFHR